MRKNLFLQFAMIAMGTFLLVSCSSDDEGGKSNTLSEAEKSILGSWLFLSETDQFCSYISFVDANGKGTYQIQEQRGAVVTTSPNIGTFNYNESSRKIIFTPSNGSGMYSYDVHQLSSSQLTVTNDRGERIAYEKIEPQPIPVRLHWGKWYLGTWKHTTSKGLYVIYELNADGTGVRRLKRYATIDEERVENVKYYFYHDDTQLEIESDESYIRGTTLDIISHDNNSFTAKANTNIITSDETEWTFYKQ